MCCVCQGLFSITMEPCFAGFKLLIEHNFHGSWDITVIGLDVHLWGCISG